MKKAFVTGATGCIGRNLVDVLLPAGWDVTVLVRKSSDRSRLNGCRVRFREVDLHDARATLDAIDEGADAMFHVAANTSHHPEDAEVQWKDNVLATRNLVEAALTKRVQRFIFTSTGATIDYQFTDEKRASEIPNGYIRTKRLAELEVHQAMARGLDAVILHPIIVVGEYDYHNYSQIFTELQAGRARLALPGSIPFCHAADVARAHLAAFEKGRPFEGYVLGGPHASWLEFYRRIAERLGSAGPRRAFRRWELLVLATLLGLVGRLTGRRPLITREVVYLLKDSAGVPLAEVMKSQRELGYRSQSLDRMIDDCYRWLVREGRLPRREPRAQDPAVARSAARQV